jgi:hypothetical protein
VQSSADQRSTLLRGIYLHLELSIAIDGIYKNVSLYFDVKA